jgi:transposase
MDSDTNKIVIIDNASIHTSGRFIDRIPDWEKKGVIIKSLPTYCPELNIIEILWRFIKYYWLPFSAYLSFDDLSREVENILAKIGSEFKIDFAS